MNSQPPPLSDSLKESVLRAVKACETHLTAVLVWADFLDQWDGCESEPARVALCNRWLKMFRGLKEVA